MQNTKQVSKTRKAQASKGATKSPQYNALSNRPVSGHSLYAHTNAALTVTGAMQSPHKVARRLLAHLIGTVAIAHHTRKGNFQIDGDSVTVVHPEYFAIGSKAVNVDRIPVSESLADQFAAFMRDGTAMKDWKPGVPRPYKAQA